jgi:DNA-binding transcriptional LysR family regulator
MKPTLHQLAVFASVAKTRSITRAAKLLHMTQPGVSIQIKQLEERYGMTLIEVIGKQIHLTAAGQELYQASQDIATRLEAVDISFSQMRGHLKGELRIAIVSTAKYFIPHWLGEFHRQYPDIAISLKVTNRETVLERLNQNQDDLVILSQIPKKLPLISEAILEDLLVIPAPPTHPFAKRKQIPLNDLGSQPFIVRESGSGTRMVMEKIFSQHQIQPKIVMELGSTEAIKQAVMAGIGLSLLSKMSIEQELKLKRLVILDIKKFPLKHPWYAVHLKGKKLSPIASNFLQFILSKHA